MRPTQITIDLPALAHNLNHVKTLAPHSKILAMVKANAYGHGAVGCLAALQTADALGVASLNEAHELQQAGWQKPIVLIEGVFSQAEWLSLTEASAEQATPSNAFAKLLIQPVIHNHTQLTWATQQPLSLSTSASQPIWLKLNTGMNRLGFLPEEIVSVAKTLHELGHSMILTSHFANADDKDHPMNEQQWQIFQHCLSQLKSKVSPMIQGSLCNSAGLINWSERQLDWVRPGIMLYGASPLAGVPAGDLNLRPVMTFSAHIFAIHDLKVGESVGYGSRWVTDTASRIGIVSVGYGDGYPRGVSEAAYVSVLPSVRLPIIGRVAMDMLMIDLTACPAITLDSPITLWGNSLSVDTVAQWNNTIGYELLCRVTARPLRHYVPF